VGGSGSRSTPRGREDVLDPYDEGDVPRWMRLATLVLAVAGLAVSAYLTYEHVTASTTLACPDTGRVNCVKVTTSSYATVAGVPVAVLGLLFFVALLPLVSPPAWAAPSPWVHRLRLAWAAVGQVSTLYLVWVELFRVHAICLWCTGVHVTATLLFVLVVFAAAFRPPARS
jgi:uncharacterized membrane protein